ncbi:AfsR family transcriptional regulator [Streptomyces sp. WAC 01529]|uniref:AfsR/SARP family transcriptional regulator n=1 Tax=Streptomyces sp. WAC 01529 TaxID=2203205 RepID=UPI000F6ED864|nr:AfsR/SARP family transcriptional regulator [Streptomyces sp. WAC 01529]AZM56525.1 AfsR family transcriptional regulator [Streptomyces sp. WAC 01529]
MDFKILGSVSAELEGRAVVLDGTKQRTVLAALLLARGQIMTDERLTTLVWGWDPPATSTSQLYTYTSRLRTRVGPGIRLERSGPGYRLDIGAATLDWETFRELTRAGDADLRAGRYARAERRLASALALWNGPALTGVTEQLAATEGHRLEEARLLALEQHAEATLALGRHAEAVSGLTREVALHPGRERLRGLLMTSLYGCGRQSDALAVYEEGRRVLAEELGIDPGPALRTLHQEILEGTLVPAPGPDTRAVWAPSDADSGRPGLAPALLPAAPYDFVGRSTEVAELLRALSAHQNVVVTGAPGTGKSALALHIAERCRDGFPQGQLYADLRTEAGAREPEEVLGWFLRALGTPCDRLPAALDERVQLYRTLLNGRRVLVLLDNATDDAQVRPLLPGSGASRTIVTGVRSTLASLEGTRLVRLGPLDPGEAVRLLAAVAGSGHIGEDADAIVRIAEFCDRLPLALRIAAARLASRPQGSATRLADRLESQERRLGELRLGSLDVGAGLRRLLGELPPPLAGAFITLAAAGPAQLTAADAAAVLGIGADDAEDFLEQLVDVALLDMGSAAGRRPRYRFPPLVRLFARQQSREALTVV